MKIDLPETNYSSHLSKLIQAALSAADPCESVKRNVFLDRGRIVCGSHAYPLSPEGRVWVFGIGKAAHAMALGVANVLKGVPWSGGLIVKHLPEDPLLCDYWLANHPVPGEDSILATQNLLRMIKQVKADDLVTFLISGGGSALLTSPTRGLSLSDMQTTTKLLLECGADIHEINTVRKHLDTVKGGGLLRQVQGRVISLILSDVIGNEIDSIASGPLCEDPSTFQDAVKILRFYELMDVVPVNVKHVLVAGLNGRIPETLKAGDSALNRVQQMIIGSNDHSLKKVQEEAIALGWQVEIFSNHLVGEAREAGRKFARKMQLLENAYRHNITQPTLLLAGGETTVTINGNGKGGRNQELALAAVEPLSRSMHSALATLATDGEDGPTDAAGAVVDGNTYRRALELGLNSEAYLANNDAYSFFASVKGLIHTGPTGTNVNDLTFGFVGVPPESA